MNKTTQSTPTQRTSRRPHQPAAGIPISIIMAFGFGCMFFAIVAALLGAFK